MRQSRARDLQKWRTPALEALYADYVKEKNEVSQLLDKAVKTKAKFELT